MAFELEETQLTSTRKEFTFRGRLTLAESGDVKVKLKADISAGFTQLLISMKNVTFIDSSGLAVFVSALKLAREAGGWLKIYGAQDAPREVFALTRLDRVFELYPTREDALESLE